MKGTLCIESKARHLGLPWSLSHKLCKSRRKMLFFSGDVFVLECSLPLSTARTLVYRLSGHLLVDPLLPSWRHHFPRLRYERKSWFVRVPDTSWFILQAVFLQCCLQDVMKLAYAIFIGRCSSIHWQIFGHSQSEAKAFLERNPPIPISQPVFGLEHILAAAFGCNFLILLPYICCSQVKSKILHLDCVGH